MELIARPTLTPQAAASDLLGKIKDLERAIQDCRGYISEVEERGAIMSLVASSSKDMVRIAKSQGQINDLMLALIQEIITLNVISYTYLADVISEFQASVKDGWRDTNGNVVTLTRAGKDFANQASAIFVKILEGSRSTREEIEGSRHRIAMLEQDLARKDNDIVGLGRVTRACADRGDEQERKIQTVEASLEATVARADRIADETRKLRTLLYAMGAGFIFLAGWMVARALAGI